MGVYMLYIADRVINSPSFRGYAKDIKEELKSEALLKMMKNYKNLKEENKDSFFGYLY